MKWWKILIILLTTNIVFSLIAYHEGYIVGYRDRPLPEKAIPIWRLITFFNDRTGNYISAMGYTIDENTKLTYRFYIPGDMFRIEWRYQAKEDAAIRVFIFRLYNDTEYLYPRVVDVPIVEINRFEFSGGNITYIYQGRQSYYLTILTLNLFSWEIRVEAYY